MDTIITVEYEDFVESLNDTVKRKFTLTIPSDVDVFEFGEEMKMLMRIIGYHEISIKECFNEIDEE